MKAKLILEVILGDAGTSAKKLVLYYQRATKDEAGGVYMTDFQSCCGIKILSNFYFYRAELCKNEEEVKKALQLILSFIRNSTKAGCVILTDRAKSERLARDYMITGDVIDFMHEHSEDYVVSSAFGFTSPNSLKKLQVLSLDITSFK